VFSQVCIGWTPLTFKLQHQTRWIGSQNSYAYIAGTGGRCAASGQSVAYGMKFGEGDVISSLLDLDNGTIEVPEFEVILLPFGYDESTSLWVW
jgi:hypothetical protein